MSIKNEWINRIASADNEFIRIYKDKDEYVIEIDMCCGADYVVKGMKMNYQASVTFFIMTEHIHLWMFAMKKKF